MPLPPSIKPSFPSALQGLVASSPPHHPPHHDSGTATARTRRSAMLSHTASSANTPAGFDLTVEPASSHLTSTGHRLTERANHLRFPSLSHPFLTCPVLSRTVIRRNALKSPELGDSRGNGLRKKYGRRAAFARTRSHSLRPKLSASGAKRNRRIAKVRAYRTTTEESLRTERKERYTYSHPFNKDPLFPSLGADSQPYGGIIWESIRSAEAIIPKSRSSERTGIGGLTRTSCSRGLPTSDCLPIGTDSHQSGVICYDCVRRTSTTAPYSDGAITENGALVH